MAGTWKLLKNVAWSSGNTIDSGTFDGQEFVKVMAYTSGANIETLLRLNGNSDNNGYTTRRGNDGSGSNQANATFFKANATGGASANAVFTTATIKGISTERKLAIINQVAVDDTGVASGDEPRRAYSAGVWFNSSDKITSVQIYNNSTGSFTSGDFISVWGASSDTVTDEKTTLTNVPENTRYEEVDTRKIYRAVKVEPKFHYKFDESSGDVINHGSFGTSANLTVTGLTRDVSSPSGIGNGMSGAGIGGGDYATNTEVNGYKFLHDGSSWSITYWSQMTELPTSSTTETFIFGNVWTDDQGTGIMVRTGYVGSSSGAKLQVVAVANNNNIPLNVTTDNLFIPDTTDWHFYALTFDGTTLTMQRDNATTGAGYKTGDKSANAFNTGNPTRKPTWFNRDVSQSDKAYGGKIAQFTIWDRVLTADEKTSLYASGNGTTTLPTPLEWKERGVA